MFDSSWSVVRLALILGSVSALTLLGTPSETPAQDIRASLFAEADAALQACTESRADLLVPKAFDRGMKDYREAEADL